MRAPLGTLAVNAIGTARVLEAARAYAAACRRRACVFVSAPKCTASRDPSEHPLDETRGLRPGQPVRGEQSGGRGVLRWPGSAQYGLDVVIARAFNHIGPGPDARFVVASFARRNWPRSPPARRRCCSSATSRRSATSSTCATSSTAYLLLARKRASAAKCITSAVAGRSTIREVLRQLITIARVPVEVREDPERMRASDLPLLVGDATKLRSRTGWAPQLFARPLAARHLRRRPRKPLSRAMTRSWQTRRTRRVRSVRLRRGELLAVPAVVLAARSASRARFRSRSDCRSRFAGEAIRAWAVGYSGVTTRGDTVTAPALVTAGPYAYVRNPLYIGNFVTAFGFAIAFTGANCAACAARWSAARWHDGRRLCGVVPHEEQFLQLAPSAKRSTLCRGVPRVVPQIEPMPDGEGRMERQPSSAKRRARRSSRSARCCRTRLQSARSAYTRACRCARAARARAERDGVVAVLEFWGGGSVAQPGADGDAVHVCMDVVALAIALVASNRCGASRRTRARRSASAASKFSPRCSTERVLLVATVAIVYEAIRRFARAGRAAAAR